MRERGDVWMKEDIGGCDYVVDTIERTKRKRKRKREHMCAI